MNISCIFGFHKWAGCKCSACSKTRDEGHAWTKDCEKCATCGATRQNAHKWAGCKCSSCGNVRDQDHDWAKDCERCSRCGATRTSAHTWTACSCSRCGQQRHEWNGTQCTKCGEKKSVSLASAKSSLVQVNLFSILEGRRILGFARQWVRDPAVAASLGVPKVHVLDLKYEGEVWLRNVPVSADGSATIPADFLPYNIESISLPNGERQAQARHGQGPTPARR